MALRPKMTEAMSIGGARERFGVSELARSSTMLGIHWRLGSLQRGVRRVMS